MSRVKRVCVRRIEERREEEEEEEEEEVYVIKE